jgi:centromeric protein E
VRIRPLSTKETDRGETYGWDTTPEGRIVAKDADGKTATPQRRRRLGGMGSPVPGRGRKGSPAPGAGGNAFKLKAGSCFGKEATTQDIYDFAGKNIVDSCMDGVNGTIFAYGQTSSGKTFTMMGDGFKAPGIMLMATCDIFKAIRETPDRSFMLRMSVCEVYNEKIHDLLDRENRDLAVLSPDPATNTVRIRNLSERIVTSAVQVYDLLQLGFENRAVGATDMNAGSSRSHTVFRMIIESKPVKKDGDGEEDEEEESDVGSGGGRGGRRGKKGSMVRVSTLNLVDLAGSESAAKAGTKGMSMREGACINKSLGALKACIDKLRRGDKHVGYRNSKLTRVLQTGLGGTAATALLCLVAPATSYSGESKETLRFAHFASKVVVKARVNQVSEADALIGRHTSEVKELQKQLALFNGDASMVDQIEAKRKMEIESAKNPGAGAPEEKGEDGRSGSDGGQGDEENGGGGGGGGRGASRKSMAVLQDKYENCRRLLLHASNLTEDDTTLGIFAVGGKSVALNRSGRKPSSRRVTMGVCDSTSYAQELAAGSSMLQQQHALETAAHERRVVAGSDGGDGGGGGGGMAEDMFDTPNGKRQQGGIDGRLRRHSTGGVSTPSTPRMGGEEHKKGSTLPLTGGKGGVGGVAAALLAAGGDGEGVFREVQVHQLQATTRGLKEQCDLLQEKTNAATMREAGTAEDQAEMERQYAELQVRCKDMELREAAAAEERGELEQRCAALQEENEKLAAREFAAIEAHATYEEEAEMREAAAAKAAKAHAKFEKMAAAREAEAAEEHADLEREHAALRAKVEESKRVREAEAKGRVQKVEYMGDRCDDISSLSKLSEETLQDREQACLHDLLAIAQARFVRQWTAREQSLKKIHAGQLRDATTELSALQSQLRFERAGSDQLRSDVSQLRAQLAQGGGGGEGGESWSGGDGGENAEVVSGADATFGIARVAVDDEESGGEEKLAHGADVGGVDVQVDEGHFDEGEGEGRPQQQRNMGAVGKANGSEASPLRVVATNTAAAAAYSSPVRKGNRQMSIVGGGGGGGSENKENTPLQGGGCGDSLGADLSRFFSPSMIETASTLDQRGYTTSPAGGPAGNNPRGPSL